MTDLNDIASRIYRARHDLVVEAVGHGNLSAAQEWVRSYMKKWEELSEQIPIEREIIQAHMEQAAKTVEACND